MICTRTIHHEDDSNRNKSSHRWFEQGQFNTTVRWFVLTHFILSRLHGLRYISAEKPYNIFKNKELDINFFFKFWSACWPFCDQFMWNLFYFYSNWKFLKTGLRPDFCICLLFLCMECTQESNTVIFWCLCTQCCGAARSQDFFLLEPVPNLWSAPFPTFGIKKVAFKTIPPK